ncbi:MAG: hypothetical protein M0C28_07450 [Candidatus Moduliflexus flocculans]|nr:hypothetical protein [Candidatus Moduliflexus flocculans]
MGMRTASSVRSFFSSGMPKTVNGRPVRRPPERLERGHLLRLGARHLDRVGVARAELEDRRDGEDGQGRLHQQGGLVRRTRPLSRSQAAMARTTSAPVIQPPRMVWT